MINCPANDPAEAKAAAARRPTKQMIVIRRDLGMRRGKEIAQGAHAAMAWLSIRVRERPRAAGVNLTPAEEDWLTGSFRKIVCQVPDHLSLIKVVTTARKAGLEVHLITDSGATEFGGVPTDTAAAIGPDYDEKIDPVTAGLELY